MSCAKYLISPTDPVLTKGTTSLRMTVKTATSPALVEPTGQFKVITASPIVFRKWALAQLSQASGCLYFLETALGSEV